MPTNEERRYVSSSMRKITHKYPRLKSQESYRPPDQSWSCSLLGRIAEAAGLHYAPYEFEADELCDRLADLIEPDPERTCHNKAAWYGNFICDECGCRVYTENDGMDDDVVMPREWKFCPNCGAKVVEE